MKRTLIIIALLALLVPGALWAQEELTLEGLAEQLAALAGRVEALESVMTGPGAIEIEGGACQIAGDGGAQNETVVEWQVQRGEWPNVDQMRVASVIIGEDGSTTVTYAHSYTDEYIEEIWNGCEFAGTGDWYDLDWEGNRVKAE